MVDAQFAHPRLAQLYDPLEAGRPDLDVYAAMAGEFAAHSVLDVGCGTGTFACMLAEDGHAVIGVDPAAASLAIARGKPGADRVRWIHGYATDLPTLHVDLITMTGNVAQVFRTDADWAATLRATHAALRPGGRLVFETRDPAARAWESWNRAATYEQASVPGIGELAHWGEVTRVDGAFVTFRHVFLFASDGARLVSESTLRFRTREEVTTSLADCGFEVAEVRDAPDRPGKEMVFIARRAAGQPGERRRSGVAQARA
ncbi:class I SAM-dependent methyltransferase [Mangrovihabitans endophyticus]|uniref:Methyltransferase n=1 Tax=Mangrovihabitans endophyticus TaxID=1751298 RepID=A0A8J3FQC6_9ACTN|nr:class I SAM-dependent methyltransferase [Mangrovihabitans endophyticus]GGL08533.1 methyltransferase [Mangrovihabitans endophyticus]